MGVLYLRNSIALILFSTLAVGFPMQNTPPRFGAVQGRVINEQGKPLSGVRVYAEPVDSRDGLTGKLRFVMTNEDGDFMLEQVVPGTNVICASKEEAFYPDTGAAALATDLTGLPRVQVEEGQVTPNVTVRLAKGGKLTGLIQDSANGEPLKNSRIRLSRSDDSRLYIETGPDEQARFQFVIPSKTFRLQVTAPGYKTWNSDDHGGAILVQPESVKELSIWLQATHGAAPN